MTTRHPSLARRLVRPALAAVLALPAPLTAQATWDNLPNGSFAATPNPYAGVDFYYGDDAFCSTRR